MPFFSRGQVFLYCPLACIAEVRNLVKAVTLSQALPLPLNADRLSTCPTEMTRKLGKIKAETMAYRCNSIMDRLHLRLLKNHLTQVSAFKKQTSKGIGLIFVLFPYLFLLSLPLADVPRKHADRDDAGKA